MRRALLPAVTAAVLLGAAPPADHPDYPVSFIPVAELKALLDRGAAADIVDVRAQPEYDTLHIRGARSIPLPSIPARIQEIPKNRLVVFY